MYLGLRTPFYSCTTPWSGNPRALGREQRRGTGSSDIPKSARHHCHPPLRLPAPLRYAGPRGARRACPPQEGPQRPAAGPPRRAHPERPGLRRGRMQNATNSRNFHTGSPGFNQTPNVRRALERRSIRKSARKQPDPNVRQDLSRKTPPQTITPQTPKTTPNQKRPKQTL